MHEDIRYLTSDKVLPFVVEMAGVSYCDGTYRIFRQHANVIVFEYVISGSGTVKVDQQVFTAGAGDIYILPLHGRHEYYSDAQDPWTKIWFNICGSVAEQLIQAYQLQHTFLVHQCPAALLDLFRQFLSAAQSEDPLPVLFDRCALIFHQILISLSHQIQSSRQIQSGEADILQAYIQQHLSDPITLSDLARLIYRSPAYTIRIFSASYHQTPYAYLAERRIEAARQLLAGTHLSVKSIADRLCYADQHYFATVFRRATGLSPRQFRQASQI
ncbi:MAG: AraC family transcriptional regulator [Clostridiaceae bacterium]|nr:AraC family transcriptional regulator [Clostridiaceae bacterium]